MTTPGSQYPAPGQYPPPSGGQQYPPGGQQYPSGGQQYPPPGGQQYPPGGQQYPSGRNLRRPPSSFAQRQKDRLKARANAVVAATLEPGEQMLTGARVHTGASDWLRMIPYFSTVALLTQRHYFMVVTDRRVIVCRLSVWTARPTNIKYAVPRAQCWVSDVDLVATFPKFKFASPQTPAPIWLRSHGYWLQELQQIINLIGGPPPGYGAQQQYQQPQPGAQQQYGQQQYGQQQYPGYGQQQ